MNPTPTPIDPARLQAAILVVCRMSLDEFIEAAHKIGLRVYRTS